MQSYWNEVSRFRLCSICGKDSWCVFSVDGNISICRRKLCNNPKYDRSGMPYQVYSSDNEFAPLSSLRSESKTENMQVADPNTLHKVYTELLNKCSLSEQHLKNLTVRGLNQSEITRRRYGSLLLANRIQVTKSLVDKYGEDICRHIPGIVLKTSSTGFYWSLAGKPGLLIPVRDIKKRIIALKIRVDENNGSGKYRTMSSTYCNGPGPGAHVHVPLYNYGLGDTVRITEGELKADIATVYDNLLTLSISGVSAWRKSFEILKRLNIKNVKIAFDKDAEHKLNVANCLKEFYQELVNQGFNVSLETW